MASPKDRDIADDTYSQLKVDCILIQNYDTPDYIGMVDYAIRWSQNLKKNGKV